MRVTHGQPFHNSSTNTDICYFNGVGTTGLDHSANLENPSSLGLLGGFGDALLNIADNCMDKDLPQRCKDAYR